MIKSITRALKQKYFLIGIIIIFLMLYFLLLAFEITPDNFKQSLTEASWAGIGLAFMTGLIFSFNPVSFTSIPVVLAYVTKAHEQKRARLMAGAFVGGMIITHIALGVSAAAGGEWVKNIMGRHWGLLLGPLLIIMGFIWAGWLRVSMPWIGIKAKKVSGLWGAFLLGIPFSVAVCPFCTPALLVTLTASAAIGSISFGFALLLAFALGRSIPILAGAWCIDWIESLHFLSQHQKKFETIAGITLILTGLYLLNEYLFII